MKRIIFSLFLVAAMLVTSFSLAAAQEKEPTVDVIIQVEESAKKDVADAVKAKGGEVRFEYSNVSALAVTISTDELSSIANLAGVTLVEKDRIFNLTDEIAGEKNDGQPMFFEVESMEGVNVEAIEAASFDVSVIPDGYANFLYTGASAVWEETGYGEGTIVAVVDTGTVPNVCLSHAVIGAPGFPDGYNSTGDGIPATSSSNHWHGTHVGGVIASSCSMSFADPTDNLYQAIATYLPWDADFVPVIGQAPEADIYPVKVFPSSGAGVPTSVILDGLDHVLSLKTDGLLDVDIVNMSLGGPTIADGLDTFDLFVNELKDANIMVVTSAGNDGPVPNSVGSPGTSFGSVAVGALDYAPSSRVLYEYLALRDGLGAGQGLVMRPTDEIRVANFSSRGPISDGRGGPDIAALGVWNFQLGPTNEVRWAGGTSFSSPTVAGAAALLNAYWEDMGYETDPGVFRNVLLKGADADLVAPAFQDFNDQGFGVLDVPAALEWLQTRPWVNVRVHHTGRLRANILSKAVKNQTETWESETITLNPSETFDAVFDISQFTSNVTIEVFDIVMDDNSAYAYWPNALEVHVQSAKRTAYAHPVDLYWYNYAYGDAFDIVIEDGPWTFWDIPWAYQPMEPGLMKLTLIGDYSNETPVSFKVRVTRENYLDKHTGLTAAGLIDMGDTYLIPVEVPEDVSAAVFDLVWMRNWQYFPTSDLDMVIYDPDLNAVTLDGATGNAPERAIVESPVAGTWYVFIEGYEMVRTDIFKLFTNFYELID